jgi:SAM-dependent methyltransferase
MAGAQTWSDEVFLTHANLFLQVHEHILPFADDEVEHLGRLLASFGVRAGARLLDVPCGIGRHSLPFARRGFRVVGVDYSPPFVSRARERAEEEGVENVRFVEGDMRRLATALRDERGTFDAVLNLWTSIGYWDDETDVRILRQFREMARTQGVLVLDTINRDHLVRHFRRYGAETYGDLRHIEVREFDVLESRPVSEWRFYRREGRDLRHEVTVRINPRAYALHELVRLVERAGWRYEGAFGGFKMEKPHVDLPRLVVVGRKEKPGT